MVSSIAVSYTSIGCCCWAASNAWKWEDTGQTTNICWSKQSGVNAQLSGKCWAGTHFGRPRFTVYGFLVPVAVGRGAPWLASSSFWGPSPLALTPLGGARFIAWRLRHPYFRGIPMGPEAFLESPDPQKRPCATLVQLVGLATNTNILTTRDCNNSRTRGDNPWS